MIVSRRLGFLLSFLGSSVSTYRVSLRNKDVLGCYLVGPSREWDVRSMLLVEGKALPIDDSTSSWRGIDTSPPSPLLLSCSSHTSRRIDPIVLTRWCKRVESRVKSRVESRSGGAGFTRPEYHGALVLPNDCYESFGGLDYEKWSRRGGFHQGEPCCFVHALDREDALRCFLLPAVLELTGSAPMSGASMQGHPSTCFCFQILSRMVDGGGGRARSKEGKGGGVVA